MNITIIYGKKSITHYMIKDLVITPISTGGNGVDIWIKLNNGNDVNYTLHNEFDTEWRIEL